MARRPKNGAVPDDASSPEDAIVKEAKKRFDRANSWEAVARKRFIDDVKFVNGDSDNLWQWPDQVRQNRGLGSRDERPCLTINKTRQHCLQIINDARQNKTSVKVHPTGNEATYEAAEVFEGIVRHIEYISDAQSAYGTATRWQVWGGIGYWRVVTDWAGDDSFDQEIFIRRIKDPLTVLVDPDFTAADGSDMRWAFVFDDMAKDEFEAAYPQYKDSVPLAPFGTGTGDDWLREDHVRVAEYFRRVEEEDHLLVITNPDTGQKTVVKESEFTKELSAIAIDDPATKRRKIKTTKIEWFLIVGNDIVERNVWPGKYIPIVRVPGEETVIEGQLDRKGHVRALKDAQRIYNYDNSANVEYGALQNKSPYVAPAQAIEGYEEYWNTANLINYSVLPYNGVDDDGNKIDAPQRQPPPMSAPAFLQGMQIAANDMMLVSGQYQADFGAPSNERSGVAIQQRQRQGENSTYHYIDHLAMATRYTGKILIDLIPKIYDTKRVIKIMAEDGTSSEVLVDPNAASAYLKRQAANDQTAEQVIFNPNVGRYDVESEVGPAFATRRQEAFNAISQILQSNPELVKVVGDLLFKSADFPMADEMAERMARTIPAVLKGEGPPPEVEGLQAQLQGAQQLMSAMAAKLQEAEGRSSLDAAKARQASEDALSRRMDAVTKRLDVLFKNAPNPNLAAELESQAALASHKTGLDMIAAEHAASLQPEPEPEAAAA